MTSFEMNSIDDTPEAGIIPHDVAGLSKEERKDILKKVSMSIVDKYVSFQFNPSNISSACKSAGSYFKIVLSLGMFYMEFVDSIKEGDGARVHRCWKYLLPIFKSSKRKNYSIEALHFLFEYEYTASPMHCHQMLWSRFINTVGKPGHNIPADLHIEHLNRALKEAVNNLGSNKSTNSIIRAKKALGMLVPIVKFFDALVQVSPPSSTHATPTRQNDILKMAQELHKNASTLLAKKPTTKDKKRQEGMNLLHYTKYHDLEDWIYKHITLY